jgi:hypothetical protein
MVRICHYLKKNHRTESPNNILIVDTESRIITDESGTQFQSFRLGYAIHLLKQNDKWSERGFVLNSAEDFWLLLDQFDYEKKKLYVFAHNMAYDYAILKLDTYISSRKLEITMRVIDSVFMIKAGSIVFLSSTNYYKQSLKDLGIIFGLSKMESPDFQNCTDEKLLPYCIRDTQVLTTIIKQHIAFIIQHDLGSFKSTIAGQSMQAFRHRFMSHDLLVHDYPEILEMEKQSYRGGRCEVFRMGKFNDITCLDINSMYPYVMKTQKYPTKLISSRIAVDVPISELERAFESDTFVLAECMFEMKKPVIACKREKLIFPIGKIRQTLTSPEIEYIKNNPECGKILSIEKAVFYQQAKIFPEYVDFFYKLRCDSKNEAVKTMCKLFMNSLYGKFGQHNSTIPELITDPIKKKMYLEIMDDANTLEVFDGLSSKYVKIGDALYYISKNDGEFARDSIPIIASTVTSYARMMLWDLMQKAGSQNVIYCDTDSLFVNNDGLANLKSEINSTELGKLKIEKSGSCQIHGAKDYTFNGKVKLKGIKENAKKISDDTYIQYQFHTKNQRYRDGTPDGIVVVKPVTKKLSRNYDKGFVCADGEVRPLVFTE